MFGLLLWAVAGANEYMSSCWLIRPVSFQQIIDGMVPMIMSHLSNVDM